MKGRFGNEQGKEDPSTANMADSPLSCEDEAYFPSPKQCRRGTFKKVVTVPIGGGDGNYRSKGEVYPPQDSWSWRKYGQKPIKGSPYPRGYYKCSSSKGCSAKKQVERSHLDTTTLLITYSNDHNHHLPTTTKSHHHHPLPPISSSPSSATTTTTTKPPNFPPVECVAFANQSEPNIEPVDSSFNELAGDFGWLYDVGPIVMEFTTLVGPAWADNEVEVSMPVGEEDELLFGDLGDLPL